MYQSIENIRLLVGEGASIGYWPAACHDHALAEAIYTVVRASITTQGNESCISDLISSTQCSQLRQAYADSCRAILSNSDARAESRQVSTSVERI